MTSVSAYRELMASIKSIGVDNISPKDKQVLIDLMKTLKYTAEFKLLKQCYDNDKSIENLLPFIDNKLSDLKSKIDAIEGKVLNGEQLSKFEEIKLKSLSVTYNRYLEIRGAIVTRDYDHYVKFMNSNITNANQIIAVCSAVLDQANVDYADNFLINGNEKSAVDIIYDLKRQPDLTHDLTVYFNRKKHYTVDNEEKVREDQAFLRYLELVKDNENLVRDFMDAIFVIGTPHMDKEVITRERLSRNKLTLADLSKNFLSVIKNGKEISSLEVSIEKDEEELEHIAEVREKYESILEEMERVGLKVFADQFVSPTANIDDTVEQRVVNYVKASMRRKSFDIKEVKRKIEEEVRFLESQIVRKEELLGGTYKSLNSYGQELVNKYPDQTEHLLDIVNEKAKGDVTPIFAAYVLKALMDSKNLSVSQLNEIMNAYDKKGVEALVTSYEAIVKNTALTVQKAIGEVTNRAVFDSSSFGQLKIG